MKKILLIEDKHALLEEVEEWLIFEGFETYTASDGQEGVKMAMTYLPDLIICDILMPKMNGLEVLETLRKNEKTKLIPFIFTTALDDRTALRLGMESGADDYITKPFTADELLRAIQTRLKKDKDAQERTSQAVDELRDNIIQSLPHELRTPLNGILGYSELLKDDPGTFTASDINRIGQTLHLSAMRLLRLVQNYLLYAELELVPFAAATSLLVDVAGKCRTVAMERAVQYKRSSDLKIDVFNGEVYLAEMHFKKIVEELVDNALKFSMPGTRVTVHGAPAVDHYVLIINDQGRGMTPEHIQQIGACMQFERKLYEQQGSGLGLTLAKRLTELYGGELTIASVLHQGTKVKVTLPRVPLSAEPHLRMVPHNLMKEKHPLNLSAS